VVWQWVPADLNQGYLANYFWLLAIIMAVDLAAFAYIARGYEYKVRCNTLRQ
jgi:hypothetical protein